LLLSLARKRVEPGLSQVEHANAASDALMCP
jgi:hypothetical protein